MSEILANLPLWVIILGIGIALVTGVNITWSARAASLRVGGLPSIIRAWRGNSGGLTGAASSSEDISSGPPPKG